MESSGIPVTIDHTGIVQSTDIKSVTVRISPSSACSGCHAEGSCNLSGKEDKIVEVHGRYDVKPGDMVTVIMEQSMGFTALFLGYILPVIPVIAVLIILISKDVPELIAGLSSIAVLIPYYTILYLFRRKINEKFRFTLKA